MKRLEYIHVFKTKPYVIRIQVVYIVNNYQYFPMEFDLIMGYFNKLLYKPRPHLYV